MTAVGTSSALTFSNNVSALRDARLLNEGLAAQANLTEVVRESRSVIGDVSEGTLDEMLVKFPEIGREHVRVGLRESGAIVRVL